MFYTSGNKDQFARTSRAPLTKLVWYWMLAGEKYEPLPTQPGTPQLSTYVRTLGFRFLASLISQYSSEGGSGARG